MSGADRGASLDRRDFLKVAGSLTASLGLGGVRGAEAASPSPDPITSLDALALSEAIHERRVSCEEVMGAFLAQIDSHNPRVNAIVSLRPRGDLLAEARLCDAELARGQSRGWMHGMPFAAKDLVDVRGLPTTSGSPLLRNNVATKDSTFIARIRAAGAVFIGKTNVPEFGLGSQSYNTVFGVTRNAWDDSRTAGGSSGGAAVALALRMVPVADGSDMMGSLRNPAGWNNVVGFRPTIGSIPQDSPDYVDLLATAGPMARTVPEAARLFATMAGHDPRDPLSLRLDTTPFEEAPRPPERGLRIGWLGDFDGYLPVEEGVLSLCRDALRHFESIGCTVAEARPEYEMAQLWKTWLVLRQWSTVAWAGPLYTDPATRARLKPELLWEIEAGLGLSGRQVSAALAARGAWYTAVAALLTRFDCLVLPTAQLFPFDADLHWPRAVAGRAMDTYHRWMEVVIPGTLSGCPVLALPAGFSPGGLPMGLQLIGRLHGDLALLRLGAAFERSTGLAARRPPGL